MISTELSKIDYSFQQNSLSRSHFLLYLAISAPFCNTIIVLVSSLYLCFKVLGPYKPDMFILIGYHYYLYGKWLTAARDFKPC